jgi:hypothetical protein
MNSMKDSGIGAGLASGQTSHTHSLRGLVVTGFIGTSRATPRRCDSDDPHPGEESPHPDRLTTIPVRKGGRSDAGSRQPQ